MRLPWVAFGLSVPIGVLGGLIGLGGAEFRLPVLAGPLRYAPRQAVPLNLAVSLITLVVSLAVRSGTDLGSLSPFLPAVVAMTLGAIITAIVGPGLAGRLDDRHLATVILALLVAIGCGLIFQAFAPDVAGGLVPAGAWPVVAFGLGLGIGLVSSLLGVAGGELIIPSFVFAFGAPIKLAGSASLLVSIPTVAVGLVGYARRGAFRDRRALRETVAPMGLGSIIGAIIGGLLVGVAPPALLEVVLGVILIVSALRVFAAHAPAGEPGISPTRAPGSEPVGPGPG